MIQEGTDLNIADNTGAKLIRCFKVLGGSKKRYGRIGDVIVASVKKAEPRRNIKKKEVVRAVIVRQRKPYRLKDGSYLSFDDNAAVILEAKSKAPRGNRISGPIPRVLKEQGFNKIVTMTKIVV